MEFQLAISYSQAWLPVAFSWVVGWVGPMEISKALKLMLEQKVSLSLSAKWQFSPIAEGSAQLTKYGEVELAWSHRSYVLVSLLWESNCRLPKENCRHQHCHQTVDQQSILPASCARAMVEQNLWEWSTNDWFSLSLMAWEGAYALHCLNGQELETWDL